MSRSIHLRSLPFPADGDDDEEAGGDEPRRRKKERTASLDGVDQEDVAAVNRLLAAAPSIEGEAPAARTPYQVQQAFVAAAEAALKAIEEAEVTYDAQRALLDSAMAAASPEPQSQPTGGMAGDGAGPLVGQPSANQTIAAQQAFLVASEEDADETEAEQLRRVAWIKYYIKMGDYDKAVELGWDGDMDFAQSLLSPTQQSADASGAATPGNVAEADPALMGAGGAEGGGGRGTALCRI